MTHHTTVMAIRLTVHNPTRTGLLLLCHQRVSNINTTPRVHLACLVDGEFKRLDLWGIARLVVPFDCIAMVFKDMRVRRLGVDILASRGSFGDVLGGVLVDSGFLAVDGAFEYLGIDVSIVVVEVVPW